MSLRNQSIIFAIALGTIPVIATGMIAYWITNPTIKTGVIRYQKTLAIGISNRIHQLTSERVNDLKVISGLGIFNDQKVVSGRTYNPLNALMENFRQSYGMYQSILVSDLTGKVMLQTQGSAVSNISNEDYFQQVQRTNQITVVKRREQGGEYVIIMAAPLRNINSSQPMGVVRTLMPVKELTKVVSFAAERLAEASEKFQSENYHLIDGEGSIFLSSNQSLVGQKIENQIPEFRQLSQNKQSISQELFNPATKENILITYIPIPAIAEVANLNWSVVVTHDTKEVFATEKQLFWVLTVVVIITSVVVSIIAALFANRTTRTITEIANVIAESSVEIASTMEQQERSTSQQAMAVNQTTSTMNELNNSARQSAEQAEGSAHGARQALNLSKQGSNAVEDTLEGMNTLREKVGAIAQQIMRLSQQTNQIGNISTIVADLANQTNMLALNASVEAVRAGEHGKGFGVVASEIRKLADQSKNSAEKINTLVADIQNSIDLTVMVTDEGTKTVEDGVKIAQETEKAFSGVSNAINDMVLSCQQISLNAEQQVTAIQQVVDAMNSLNSSAQENVQGISQVKTRTQELSQAAQTLQGIV
ncbi:methyl-accepting chemotaxis protein [Planktothricoides raciborskii]|uniref:Methyl-accepting chemotaxis protein n=1 Tax=Planktothricoides raciborskii FACHB-1370 TaxID=2949576 RepID=A0ABR8EN44_9CYAN|nr:methyl-accepting chemotaxis protein [Planktothricoides raciborskii]MBD2547378.1 methyl-accepting chemotaxis protein [Planktothricoides raciborskii FACHB-1370]MBD2585901.1 methyl-accepting chemotaxis protein [Planktothricoides raciborskii FACHB-1261]